MKRILPLIMLMISLLGMAQEEGSYLLKGLILGPDTLPVPGAYIINYNDLKVYSSKTSGRFNIWVQPGDSLKINHVSYIPQMVYADSVRIKPNIILEIDTRTIKQVDIGPDKQAKYLEETVKSIKNTDIIIYKRMSPETKPVGWLVMQENKLLRNEASSIRLASFSTGEVIGLFVNEKRKKRKDKGFRFYRNEKHKERKERKTEKKDNHQ